MLCMCDIVMSQVARADCNPILGCIHKPLETKEDIDKDARSVDRKSNLDLSG